MLSFILMLFKILDIDLVTEKKVPTIFCTDFFYPTHLYTNMKLKWNIFTELICMYITIIIIIIEMGLINIITFCMFSMFFLEVDRCFTGFLQSQLHISLVHFCRKLLFLPSNTHLHSQHMSFECPWLVYPFDYIKHFQVQVFDFIWNTYCTKRILNSFTAPITLVHINDEWVVMKFIMIQINKCWSD